MKTYAKEDPCWFGFPLIVRKDAPFTRNQLTEYLEKNKIGTRNIFSGNLLKHHGYKNILYKTAGPIKNADIVMSNAFWLGVFPGIQHVHMVYIIEKLRHFLQKNTK